MTQKKRNRRMYSVKKELLKKSQEAALAAVQTYNNPNITFKAETYVVLMIIAWTYLLHAYYRMKKVGYRHFNKRGNRRRFVRTKNGAFKYWELEQCLNCTEHCPLDGPVVKNLKFLIGLRHEVEHQMTTSIDDLVCERFQACCINYHEAIVKLFGESYGIARYLSLSLQFSSFVQEQVDMIERHPELPKNLRRFIKGFDGELSDTEVNSGQFAYRVIFVPQTVNHPSQADRAIKFAKADSESAKNIDPEYVIVKETEKPKWLPRKIVERMKTDGFVDFGMRQHTQLWKLRKAKDKNKGFGVTIANQWYWYESWVNEVRAYCKENFRRSR